MIQDKEENRQGAKAPRSEPSAGEDRIAKLIVHATYLVHKTIGPGLLESIYEACFCHELGKAGLAYRRQVPVPLIYDGLRFEEAFRLDVLVEDVIICELKAVEKIHPVHQAQLLSHLKLTRRNLGFLVNFNVPLIKDGIHRVISNA